jgi:folate-dependent tRNA-U54 methylase TrmFO/GidA
MARNEILVIGAGLVGSEFANEEGVGLILPILNKLMS